MKKLLFGLWVLCFIRCGDALPTGEAAPRSVPVIMDGGYATVLADDGKAYAVSPPGKSGAVVTPLPIDRPYAVGEKCVIDKAGKLWGYLPNSPDKVEHISLAKPVKKYVSFGNYDLLLFNDGTLSLLFPAMLGMPSVPNAQGKHLERVDLTSFPPLQDAVAGGKDSEMYILGLDASGGVHIAGGDRRGTISYLLPGKTDTFLTKAIKVPGLPPIKRIGKLDPAYFPCAIDASGTVHYWQGHKSIPTEIQQLDQTATYVHGGRLRTPEGATYRTKFSADRQSATLEPVGPNDYPEGHLLWRTKDYSLQRYGIGPAGELVFGEADLYNKKPPALEAVPDLHVDLSFFQ